MSGTRQHYKWKHRRHYFRSKTEAEALDFPES